MKNTNNLQSNNLSYSIRRYYVDEFYLKNIKTFIEKSNILDIGGKKINKRGRFNIEKYNLKIKYANIDSKTNPNYLCDASHIPVDNNSFDGIICAEVLEHTENPAKILKEAFRILKPGGHILVTSPFLFPIHADPNDHGRYTDFYWKNILKNTGFVLIKIEKQGLFFSTLINMLKLWIYNLSKNNKPKLKIIRIVLKKIIILGQKKAIKKDQSKNIKDDQFYNKFTTGFGIIAKK